MAVIPSLAPSWADESKPAPDLNITVISDHEVGLNWARYRQPLALERQLPDQKIFTQIAVMQTGTQQYIDRDLPPNAEIIYRLKPVDSRNLDEYGPTKAIKISLLQPPPPLLTRIGISTVRIAADSLYDWVKYIAVQRIIGGTYKTIDEMTKDSTSFIDDHLETGSYLYYRICQSE